MGTAKRKYDYGEYRASCSSLCSPAFRRDYEVFLSFKGADTRIDITDHLFHALMKRGIPTFNYNFNNEQQLQKDIEIESSLVSVIHRSKIFIVIFSERYATSKWCLLELAEIAERMQEYNRGEIIVMPVFYKVSPSDVRNLTGSFETAFRDHQKNIDPQTIEAWKKALRVVSEVRGSDIPRFADGYEGELIQVVTKRVFSVLRNIKMWPHIAHRETMDFSAKRGIGMTTDFRWQTLSSSFSLIDAYKFSRPFHVFINHRGPDTKHSIVALLYERLTHLGLNAFLDKKSMMLGEALDKIIETAIQECKVGLAIISPNYCASDNCLNELAMMMECEKEVIPIFFDVKVSDLVVKGDGSFSAKQLHRFRWALEFAKGKVGIVFDSSKEDWSDLINKVSENVLGMINQDREIEEINYYPHRLLC